MELVAFARNVDNLPCDREGSAVHTKPNPGRCFCITLYCIFVSNLVYGFESVCVRVCVRMYMCISLQTCVLVCMYVGVSYLSAVYMRKRVCVSMCLFSNCFVRA